MEGVIQTLSLNYSVENSKTSNNFFRYRESTDIEMFKRTSYLKNGNKKNKKFICTLVYVCHVVPISPWKHEAQRRVTDFRSMQAITLQGCSSFVFLLGEISRLVDT